MNLEVNAIEQLMTHWACHDREHPCIWQNIADAGVKIRSWNWCIERGMLEEDGITRIMSLFIAYSRNIMGGN